MCMPWSYWPRDYTFQTPLISNPSNLPGADSVWLAAGWLTRMRYLVCVLATVHRVVQVPGPLTGAPERIKDRTVI